MLDKETAKGQSKVSPSMIKFIVAFKDFLGKLLRNQLINTVTGRLGELPQACKFVYTPLLVIPWGRVKDV